MGIVSGTSRHPKDVPFMNKDCEDVRFGRYKAHENNKFRRSAQDLTSRFYVTCQVAARATLFSSLYCNVFSGSLVDIQQWGSARHRCSVMAMNFYSWVGEQCRDWRKELTDGFRRCSRDSWFQSVIVRGKMRTDMGSCVLIMQWNVVSSADLVFRSFFWRCVPQIHCNPSSLVMFLHPSTPE